MATLRSVLAAVALFLALSCGLSRQRLSRMPRTRQAAMTRLETTADGACCAPLLRALRGLLLDRASAALRCAAPRRPLCACC
jgi:hypothetical protein